MTHQEQINAATYLLQTTTGLDVTSEHGRNTPARFVRMLDEMTTPDNFDFTVFKNTMGLDEMVVVLNIPFFTLCQHHIVPFYGYAHIGYVPQDYIAGLSKFARAVRSMAKGLWVQEHLTYKLADWLESRLNPAGVAVVMEAEHMCMTMRGVQVPGTMTTTSAMRGVFADHTRTAKAEFMQFLERGRSR